MQLAQELRATIIHAANNAPRSRQQAVGLSEVGELCSRRTAYKILSWPKTNANTDPWASIQGTAVHAWLADAFENNDRFLVEHPVMATEHLGGTCDLFDIESGMVIDHKCVGPTSMKSRKKSGMTHQQRVQINLYGLGMENQGYKVNKVALAFYPMGGRLDGMHTIVEDYNREFALKAIDRFETTQALVWQLDPEASPETWELIPSAPSYNCNYCPFYLPNSDDLSVGCPGESGELQ